MPSIKIASEQIWLKNSGLEGQVWNCAVSGIPAGSSVVRATLSFAAGNTYNPPGHVYVYAGTSNGGSSVRLWHMSGSGGGSSYAVDVSSYISGNGTFPFYFQKSGNETSKNYQYFTSIEVTVEYSIPASTFTLSKTTLNAGEEMSVTISAQNSGYRHRVLWAFGSKSHSTDLNPGVTSVKYTIPMDWLSEIPSSVSGLGTVTVETYNGETRIGTNAQNFTLTCPSTIVPVVGEVTVTPGESRGWGLYIQNKSTAIVTVGDSKPGEGAKIATVTISAEGYSASGEKPTLNIPYLKVAGNRTVTVTATDTRGRFSTKNVTFKVEAYSPVTITGVTCMRCDDDGNPSPVEGTTAKLGCSYICTAVGENSANVQIAYRTSDISWTEILDWSDVSGYEGFAMEGELSVASVYEFRFTVSDAFSSAEQIATVPSGQVFMRWDKKTSAIGFGCFPQGSNRVELDQWDLIVKGRDIDKTLDEIEANQNTMANAVEQRTRVRNLLDNSDFRNPVNQRSIPTGANNYSLGYTIDRWIYQSTSQTNSYFGLTNDYVSIAPPSVSGGYSEMFQRFEHWDASWVDLKGKKCTFAAKMHNNATGTWDVYTATLTMGDCAGGVSLDGTKSVMIYSIDSMHIAVRVFNNGNGGTPDERCFMWFALYEGEFTKETLPTYMPKGYAAELAECQRYFQKRSGQFPSLVSTNATRSYYIPFTVPMRISPTVSIWSGDEYNAWTKIGTYAGGTIVLDQAWNYGARLYGRATGQTANQPYWLWCDIVASAEL